MQTTLIKQGIINVVEYSFVSKHKKATAGHVVLSKGASFKHHRIWVSRCNWITMATFHSGISVEGKQGMPPHPTHDTLLSCLLCQYQGRLTTRTGLAGKRGNRKESKISKEKEAWGSRRAGGRGRKWREEAQQGSSKRKVTMLVPQFSKFNFLQMF